MLNKIKSIFSKKKVEQTDKVKPSTDETVSEINEKITPPAKKIIQKKDIIIGSAVLLVSLIAILFLRRYGQNPGGGGPVRPANPEHAPQWEEEEALRDEPNGSPQDARRREPIAITRKPETKTKNKINKQKCLVCFEDKHRLDFYRLECGHEFCRNCLYEAIEQAINCNRCTGDSRFLRCPNCSKEINNSDISNITGNDYAEVSNRLSVIQTKEFIQKQPENIRRHCQTPNCDFYYLNYNNVREVTTCPQCNKRFCSNCCLQHSMDVTCKNAKKIRNSESKISKKERKANEAWLKNHTKPCPQCKFRIERNGGCRHITCQKCRHQFCWVCLKKFRYQNHNHPIAKGTEGYCNGGMTGCPDPLFNSNRFSGSFRNLFS